MVRFISGRERRLWLWTLAVVVAIYSTLGLAGMVAGALGDDDLAAVFFVLGMLLVGATVVTQGLKARPGGAEIGVALGVAVVYLMVLFRMTIPERSHLIEYGVVAVFIYEALGERAAQGRRVPVPAVLAVLATSLVGMLDECIQLFLPNRVFDPLDMVFNFLAAAMVITTRWTLEWVRCRSRSIPPKSRPKT